MTFERILVQKDECIATLTLNRPEKYNAMDLTFLREFKDCLEGLGRDAEIRAMVLGILDVARVGDHAHRLEARDAARDQREVVARRLRVVEAALTARPCHPAAGVRRPFRRHGEACLGRSLAHAARVAAPVLTRQVGGEAGTTIRSPRPRVLRL